MNYIHTIAYIALIAGVAMILTGKVDVIYWAQGRAEYGSAKLMQDDGGTVYVRIYGKWTYLK